MTTQTQGGLVGLCRSIAENPLKAITAIVFAAGFIAVCRTAGVVLHPGIEVLFGVLLGFAALTYEFAAARYATRSFRERSISGILGWSLVWAAAFVYSANAWLGFASEGQEVKSTAQKAAFVRSDDSEKQEAELTKRNADLLQRISIAPVRTPEAAQSAIDRAKADRLWMQTKGCTENVRGTTTRPFCDAYASAVADHAGGIELKTLREEQKAIAKELTDIRTKRAEAGAVVASKERNDLGILIRYTSLGERGAMDLQAILKVLAISAFLSLTGLLLEMQEGRDQPRKPWPWSGALSKVWRGIRNFAIGKPSLEQEAASALARGGKIEFSETRTDATQVHALKDQLAKAFKVA